MMMLRILILLTIIIVSTSFTNVALSNTTQLIPCDVIDKLSPANKVYHHYLFKHFREKANYETKNPIFTMYVLPAIKPEYVFVVYKTQNDKFVVEKFGSKENIWYSLLNQVEKRNANIDIGHVPLDTFFVLPSIDSLGKKEISDSAAYSLQVAIEYAIKNRRYNPDELKTKHQYLDWTSFYFMSADNSCGWPSLELNPGPAKQLLVVGDVLEEYLSGKVKEAKLVDSAMRVVEEKEK